MASSAFLLLLGHLHKHRFFRESKESPHAEPQLTGCKCGFRHGADELSQQLTQLSQKKTVFSDTFIQLFIDRSYLCYLSSFV